MSMYSRKHTKWSKIFFNSTNLNSLQHTKHKVSCDFTKQTAFVIFVRFKIFTPITSLVISFQLNFRVDWLVAPSVSDRCAFSIIRTEIVTVVFFQVATLSFWASSMQLSTSSCTHVTSCQTCGLNTRQSGGRST
jgi:hypothetical protein